MEDEEEEEVREEEEFFKRFEHLVGDFLMAVRKMSVPKGTDQPVDRIKELYPLVNEAETPLPRSWSPKDKFNFIGLSQNNLKVHYKGTGTK